jgi:hypothetical protein
MPNAPASLNANRAFKVDEFHDFTSSKGVAPMHGAIDWGADFAVPAAAGIPLPVGGRFHQG